MVRDGIYYGAACIAVALLVGWFSPVLAVIPLLLAAFFLWFFRDPERVIPAVAGAIVSPADGKITDVSVIDDKGSPPEQDNLCNCSDVADHIARPRGVARDVINRDEVAAGQLSMRHCSERPLFGWIQGFEPTPTEDRIFRCRRCGYVYTDDADVDRSRCYQCGQMNEAFDF